MSDMITKSLKEMGLELPEPSTPGGNYSSLQVRGTSATIAIQFPILNGAYLYQGRLGRDLSTEDGYQALHICALNVLAQINKHLLLARLEGLNHLDIYYQSEEEWDDAPLVANGASDLFVKLLGEKGRHTRSLVGVHTLPRGFAVGLTASLTLHQSRNWGH